jgi:hypothetical protein
MNLENELRDALRRQEPQEGFAERVVQKARMGRPEHAHPRSRFLWPAAALAASAALVLSISIEYRSIQEERAAQQTIQALRMASEELNIARNTILNQ